VYPRHRLDLRPRHLAAAAAACVLARDAGRLEREVEAAAAAGALVCFSVRSAFDLLLEALALPAGSEVLLTAITHPDMAVVAERHGLVPVPVDVDVETLGPVSGALAEAATEHTRLLVVAHLFGGRVDLDALVDFARSRGLLLVEDCAQTIRAAGDDGDPRSDAALFSFGSIKTEPALGGALAYVRDPGLRARMAAAQADWPRQARRAYALRVVRFAGLLALGQPLVYGAFVRAGALAGLDVDALVNRSVHALRPPAPGRADEFGRWLRQRPSAPLLALLRRRLREFDGGRLARRAARGEEALRSLPASLAVPGARALERTHWVFPVVADSPAALVAALRRAGFDATAATTSLAAIAPPPGRPAPLRARRMLERVVFLPVYPELPARAFARLLAALHAFAGEPAAADPQRLGSRG
jgi:dTDP-4-amino-4,6-dideoxygalactose transaminase